MNSCVISGQFKFYKIDILNIFILVNKLITFRIPIKFLLIFANDYWLLAYRYFKRPELGPMFLSPMV